MEVRLDARLWLLAGLAGLAGLAVLHVWIPSERSRAGALPQPPPLPSPLPRLRPDPRLRRTSPRGSGAPPSPCTRWRRCSPWRRSSAGSPGARRSRPAAPSACRSRSTPCPRPRRRARRPLAGPRRHRDAALVGTALRSLPWNRSAAAGSRSGSSPSALRRSCWGSTSRAPPARSALGPLPARRHPPLPGDALAADGRASGSSAASSPPAATTARGRSASTAPGRGAGRPLWRIARCGPWTPAGTSIRLEARPPFDVLSPGRKGDAMDPDKIDYSSHSPGRPARRRAPGDRAGGRARDARRAPFLHRVPHRLSRRRGPPLPARAVPGGGDDHPPAPVLGAGGHARGVLGPAQLRRLAPAGDRPLRRPDRLRRPFGRLRPPLRRRGPPRTSPLRRPPAEPEAEKPAAGRARRAT